MKKFIYCLLFLVILSSLLLFPQETSEYAKEGLLMWFRNMIPALFPFMVLQALAVHLNVLNTLTKITHPVLRLLGFSQASDYAILTGFLCGFPMGAVSIRELYRSQSISKKEANYLLAFCNNIGPVFFFSIIAPLVKDSYAFPLFLCMYGIPLLYGFILGNFFYRKKHTHINMSTIKQHQNAKEVIPALTDSIHSGIHSIVYLGGCMVFFNMLRIFPSMLYNSNEIFQYFTTALLEINGSLAILSVLKQGLPEEIVLLFLCIVHFGGLSCIIQSAGILSDTDLSVRNYVFHKILQTVIWIPVAFFFIMILSF